jgi:hypothetical protein
LRTGAVGNRTADDMVNTLVEPKKSVLSSIRKKLLASGFSEEVEYDSINIEPVLIYSKSDTKVLFLKHKWELTALIPIISDETKEKIQSILKIDLSKYETNNEEGKSWLKLKLPEDEDTALKIAELM